MDTISLYPSSTIQVKLSSGRDDDDVSTLSGGSNVLAQKKTSEQPIKTMSKPHLNSSLPVHVSAMLENRNESKGVERNKIPKIPNAINVNFEGSGKDLSGDERRINRENGERSTASLLNTPSSYRRPLKVAQHTSISDSNTTMSSPSRRRASPAINAARRQRLIRLRRHTFGNKINSSTNPHTSGTGGIQSLDQCISSSNANHLQDGIVINKDRKEIATMPDEDNNAVNSTPKSINLVQSLNKSNLEPCIQSQDDLVTLPTNELFMTKDKEQKDAPLVTSTRSKSSNACSSTSSELQEGFHSSNSSYESESISKEGDIRSSGRIHRSFWSVPVTPAFSSHTPSRTKSTKREKLKRPSNSPAYPIFSKEGLSDSESCVTSTSILSTIFKDCKSFDSPSLSPMISRPSPQLFDAPRANTIITPQAPPPPPPQGSRASLLSTNHDNLPSKTSNASKTSIQDSTKSFEDIYNEVIGKLRSNKTPFVTKLNENKQDAKGRNKIVPPPALTRLLLGTESCFMGRCNGVDSEESCSSDEISVFVDTSGMIDIMPEDELVEDMPRLPNFKLARKDASNDFDSKSCNDINKQPPKGILQNSKAQDNQGSNFGRNRTEALHSNKDTVANSGFPRGDQSKNDANYTAKLSIDITGDSPREINRIIADMQDELVSRTIADTNTKVNIRFASSKCDRSVATLQSPTATAATWDSIESPTSSGVSSKVYKRRNRESKSFHTKTNNLSVSGSSMKRKSLLLNNPVSKILKKLRQATERILRNKSKEKTTKLEDDRQLLHQEKGFFYQASANFRDQPDHWFASTSFDSGDDIDPFQFEPIAKEVYNDIF